jgi:hypothetical protein
LLALCRILFGGFGGHSSRRMHSRSPEERERFRQAMGGRWGCAQSPGESKASAPEPQGTDDRVSSS